MCSALLADDGGLGRLLEGVLPEAEATRLSAGSSGG